MEIQSGYISSDELKEIAYQMKPSKVLIFCRVNKLMKTICDSDNFWKNYISNNQEKYEKLVLALVRLGNIKLFKRLWGNGAARPKEVISEPRLLYQLFELAYSNGHEELADHLLDLDNKWRDYKEKVITSTEDLFLLFDIHYIYDKWDESTTPRDEQSIIRAKIRFLAKLALSSGSSGVEEAIRLLRDLRKYKGALFEFNALEDARSLSDAKKILAGLSTAIKPSFFITRILSAGNFPLAREIIDEYPQVSNFSIILGLITSKSPYSLRFLREIMNEHDVVDFVAEKFYMIPNVGSKKMIYYLLKNISNEKVQKHLIFTSFDIFAPSEYVDLLMEYFGCLTRQEVDGLILNSRVQGYYYMATTLEKYLSVCYND